MNLQFLLGNLLTICSSLISVIVSIFAFSVVKKQHDACRRCNSYKKNKELSKNLKEVEDVLRMNIMDKEKETSLNNKNQK